MLEIIIAATLLTAGIYFLRTNHRKVRSLWGEARWYERLMLCLLFVPIPGPIDEIVALLAIRRITQRRN